MIMTYIITARKSLSAQDHPTSVTELLKASKLVPQPVSSTSLLTNTVCSSSALQSNTTNTNIQSNSQESSGVTMSLQGGSVFYDIGFFSHENTCVCFFKLTTLKVGGGGTYNI